MLAPEHYQLGEKLSENPYRMLVRAFDTRSRQPVILKILLKQPSAEELVLFQHEYETTRLFDQPNIIKAIRMESVQQCPLICFEDINGQALSKICQHRRLDPKRFLRIALEVAYALRDIHAKGVIHKDINPDNLIFHEKTGQLQVIDFGIASRVGRETTAFESIQYLLGTPEFMSPEQTGRMNRTLNQRTDFYSLGATLHRLACGSNPFTGRDVSEVIYAQLAKRPLPIHSLNDEYPTQLSKIVSKLLEKSAEDRYQSAAGLIWDLEESARQFENFALIENFPLGTRDVEACFQPSEKLYGREEELRQLQEHFEAIREAGSCLCFIGGYSGVGKTSLVQELHKSITAHRGFFISGKFDQLERNRPFRPFLQAYRSLIQQILTLSELQLKSWTARILSSLGDQGRVLSERIPELEWLIGPQPPVASLPSLEAHNRFNLVLRKFTSAVCGQGLPLVIFIDDLQWADGASLQLMELLAEDPEMNHLLMIGTFRDNEIGPTHPLTLSARNLRARARRFCELQLKPLRLDDVTALLADSFHREAHQIRAFAALCRNKTDGNPFFLAQFLRSLVEANAIRYETESRQWVWDLEQIQGMTVTANMLNLIEERLQRLPEATRELLATAACLGHQFPLKHLSHLSGKSIGALNLAFEAALREGVLLGIHKATSQEKGCEYAFTHDRFQHAAYMLRDESGRRNLHYQIGKLLATQAQAGKEERFELTNHLNLGHREISSQAEWLDLVSKNLAAAQAAKQASAFELSDRFAQTGLEMLEHPLATTAHAPERAELRAHLLRELVELDFLLGRHETLGQRRAAFLAIVSDPLRAAPVHEFQIAADMAQVRFDHALAVGLSALSALGYQIPPTPNQAGLLLKLLKVRFKIKRITHEQWLALNPMEKPEALAAMRLLQRLMTSAYSVRPSLMAYIVCVMIELTLEEGLAPESAYGFGAYALVIAGVFRDELFAKDLGELALKIARRHGDPSLLARVLHLVNMFIRSRSLPFGELVKDALENYRIALECGDFEYTAMAIMTYIVFRIFGGDSLAISEPDVAAFVAELRRLKQETVLIWGQILHQVQLNYLGKSANPVSLEGLYFGPNTEAQLLSQHDTKAIFMYYQQQFSLAVYFRRVDKAREVSTKLLPYVKDMLGSMGEAEYWSGHSLMLLLDIDQVASSERLRRRLQIQSNQRKLRRWAELGPDNHLARYVGIQGEQARIRGKYEEARTYFDRSIKIAERTKSSFWEGFSSELAAEMFTRIEQQLLAGFYLQNARLAYQRAGAEGKVKDLEARYPDFFTTPLTLPEPKPNTGTTLGRRTEQLLDLNSAIRAAQAISSEIRLESLNEKTLKIMIENAGATRGCFLIEQDQNLFVEADCRVWNGELLNQPIVREPALYNGDHAVPVGVIKYVLRSRQPLVLEDALLDATFGNDPYILQTQLKSVLCLPLLQHGSLLGALYLENELSSDAFPARCIELLQFIAAQVAISQQNARLFEALRQSNLVLEQRVVERTEELAAKNDQILSGIRYAERIQNAILPDLRLIHRLLPEFMVLFQPLDLISGDFYWFAHHEPLLFLAVVDCTGHGVPGALMSMIGHTLLNKIINEDRIFQPNKILDALHLAIQKALKQEDADLRSRDGMDLGLLVMNRHDFSAQYAGARRPLLLLRGESIEEIRGDRKSIGGGMRKPQPNFSHSALQFQPGDQIYLTTDGYTDQANPQGQRYGSPRFNEFLLQIKDWDLYGQREALCREFDSHRAGTPQRDDITIAALKIPRGYG